MNGHPWPVSRFAATLRRELCRKHLGLIPAQNNERPDANFEPIGIAPNIYDLGSPEDNIVADPLSDTFQSLWNSRARTNTDVFRKVFRVVPDDNVRTWADYKEFHGYYFMGSNALAGGSPINKSSPTGEMPPQDPNQTAKGVDQGRYHWGHVVSEDFPGGVREVKEELSKVKGTLVEMPLMFLIEEDIAQKALEFNSLTAEIYT